MHRFDVIPLRLGVAASEPLEGAQQAFYGNVIQLLTGGQATFVGSTSAAVTSISATTLFERPQEVYAATIDAASDVDPTADFVIFDFATPGAESTLSSRPRPRGSVYPHLAGALDRVCTAPLEGGPGFTLVMLMQAIPPAGDAFLQKLGPHIQDGRIILVADDGAVVPEDCASDGWSEVSYKRHLATIRRDSLGLLRLKLIRRLGWFRRDAEHGEFVRYHYDGSLCADEIQRLVGEYLDRGAPSPPDLCLLHYPISPWFQEGVEAACLERGIEFAVVEEYMHSADVGEPTKTSSPLVIVPVVDTGDTVLAVLNDLSEAGIGPSPSVLALLSTRGGSEYWGHRAIHRDHEQYARVDYVLRVEQERIDFEDGGCHPVVWGLAPSTLDRRGPAGLSSYEFWDLVHRSGVKPEDNVPDHRPSLGLVPDFPAMLRQFGAWLATELWSVVSVAGRVHRDNVVFVCPLDERGSTMLAEYLRAVVGVEVVQVPKAVVDGVRDGLENGSPLEAVADSVRLVNSSESWFVELTSSPVDGVIVLDEFVVSGGTLRGFRALLEGMGRYVIANACLADFSGMDDTGGHAPTYSLYRLPAAAAGEAPG